MPAPEGAFPLHAVAMAALAEVGVIPGVSLPPLVDLIPPQIMFGPEGNVMTGHCKSNFSIVGEVFAVRHDKRATGAGAYQILPRYDENGQYVTDYWLNPAHGVYSAFLTRAQGGHHDTFITTNVAVRVSPFMYGCYDDLRDTIALEGAVQTFGSNVIIKVENPRAGGSPIYYVVLTLKGPGIVAKFHNIVAGRRSTIAGASQDHLVYRNRIRDRPLLWFQSIGFQYRNVGNRREIQIASRGGRNRQFGITEVGIAGFMADIQTGCIGLGFADVGSAIASQSQLYDAVHN